MTGTLIAPVIPSSAAARPARAPAAARTMPLAVPLGIGVALYLTEYGKDSKFANTVRYFIDVMTGVPSIVMGIAIYSLIVMPQKHFSAFSGGVALGIMMVPTITRTTEEMLATVPPAIREAALGLGVPKWRTAISVSLRTASPGIITGCMLAFARVAGETAPLIFVCSIFSNQLTLNIFGQAVPNIPVSIFTLSEQADPSGFARAWGAALVLLAFILVTNVSARALLARSRARLSR